MQNRSLFGALLLAAFAIPLSSCGTEPSLTSITVSPSTMTATPTTGLQTYFIAIGNYTRPNHAPVTKDITDQVAWSSSIPQMVTVSNTGVATVTGDVIGNSYIFASAPGFHGDIIGSANFIVALPPSTSGNSVAATGLSIAESRSSDGKVRFTAVGKTSDGRTIKLAGQPKWISTDNMVATIDQATGIATTIGPGRTTVAAVYTNPDGTTAVGVTHFNVASSVATN